MYVHLSLHKNQNWFKNKLTKIGQSDTTLSTSPSKDGYKADYQCLEHMHPDVSIT
jgi:hypothetical protein